MYSNEYYNPYITMELKDVLPKLRGFHINGERAIFQDDILSLIEEDEEKWTALRNQAAIAAMQGLISNDSNESAYNTEPDTIVRLSVEYADKLIRELKKEQWTKN